MLGSNLTGQFSSSHHKTFSFGMKGSEVNQQASIGVSMATSQIAPSMMQRQDSNDTPKSKFSNGQRVDRS